ncbi:MAG: glutamine amidotransferase-related protein, partial [Ilumatobacteraceae bacterium]
MSAQPLIAVLDYGIGNLRSAQKALQRCGADARLTVDHGLIADADAVVLPGVGAFGACMAALRDADLEVAVRSAVDSGRPFLGICVGMQMLFDSICSMLNGGCRIVRTLRNGERP